MPQRRRTGSVKAADAATIRLDNDQLARVAELLEFPVAKLFEGRAGRKGVRDLLRLAQAFARIKDRELRRALVALMVRIAAP